MAHMKACSGGVGEHVEYVELLFCLVFNNLVGLVFYPSVLPFLFDFSEIIFHISCCFLCFFVCINKICSCKVKKKVEYFLYSVCNFWQKQLRYRLQNIFPCDYYSSDKAYICRRQMYALSVIGSICKAHRRAIRLFRATDRSRLRCILTESKSYLFEFRCRRLRRTYVLRHLVPS